jgi:hypothetical protein
MKLNRKGRGGTFLTVFVIVAGLLIVSHTVQSQTFTIGTYGGGAWTSDVGISGFGIANPNTDGTVGQTFSINNVTALINSIQVPIYGSSLAEFQIGIASWNGSQPTGSMLYLSSPIAGVNGWQTFTVDPNNLVLNQNQQYLLLVTPNNFVNTSQPYNTGMGYVPSYSGGEMYNLAGYELGISDLFANSWSDAGGDFAFSIAYQVVPEPGIPALLGLGALAFWWRYRAYRKSA